MPAAAIDLTTVAAVKALLQESSAIPDDTLQTMITAASRVVLKETKREFAPTTDGVARDFLSNGAMLDLSPYDLRGQPEEVTLYSDLEEVDQEVLEASDYRARPIPSESGVFTWLELPSKLRGKEVQVTVKGNWGFASVPEDVAYWCGMTVVIWARSDISAFSTTYNVDEGRVERPEDLPPAVKHGLSDYRRRTVG